MASKHKFPRVTRKAEKQSPSAGDFQFHGDDKVHEVKLVVVVLSDRYI